MKKKLFFIVLALVLCFGLVACSGDSNNSGETSKDTAKIIDLTGTWKQIDGNSEDTWQEATISDGIIEINWVSDGGDTKALYWKGTVEIPENEKEFNWTSQGDVEEMTDALLASQDETKEFTYKDDVISYEASAMGVATTVKLEKQK